MNEKNVKENNNKERKDNYLKTKMEVKENLNIFPQDTIVESEKKNNKLTIQKNENIISTIIQTKKIKKDSLEIEKDNKMENKFFFKTKNSDNLDNDYFQKSGDFSFIKISKNVNPFFIVLKKMMNIQVMHSIISIF